MNNIVLDDYELDELTKLLRRALIFKSDIKPDKWYEQRMFMPFNSAIPGRVKYDNTPFYREIVNRVSPEDPTRDISLMAMAQGGKTSMVIHPVIGYIISENPGNILYLTGGSDLTKPGMLKIDNMIDTCNIRHLIKPNSRNARSRRTGDTVTEKHFRDGILLSGSITNHNILRQHDIKFSIADDLDGGKLENKETGGTVSMITGRTKAFEYKCKRFWIGSPQKKGSSLLELQMLKGDERHYMIPCPKCKEFIQLHFQYQVDNKNMAGLTWKLDNLGRVERNTVGYICQLCGEYFQENHKYEFNINGHWKPSKESQEPLHVSYYMNGMYLPAELQSWYGLATKYIMCNPPGQARKEADYQTFKNLWLGELYEELGESIEGNEMMNDRHVRGYKRSIVPEQTSINDGNGEIILLTWAADCNGKLNDARLDWEIKAWSTSGAVYSVDKGSVGTFVPGEKPEQRDKNPRISWSYDMGKPNNVWKEVDEILGRSYLTERGKVKKIFCSGIDVGHCGDQIYEYIDKRKGRFKIFGLMGDKEHEMIKQFADAAVFKQGRARSNMYMLNVNKIKDSLASHIKLPWEPHRDNCQPYGYLNFPEGYEYKDFYSHYEGESKIEDEKTHRFMWKRKGFAPNHFWDVGVYHIAVKEILLWQIFKKGLNQDQWNWTDFTMLFRKKKK